MSLSEGLRNLRASYVGESSLRRVVANLRDRSDKLASWLESRDAKLRQKD
jgi:hypothetical protein